MVSKLATPLLAKIPTGVYKQLMIQALAQRTGLETEALQELVDISPPVVEQPPQPAPTPKPRQRTALARPSAGFSNLTQSATALLLHRPDIARLVTDLSALQQLEGEDMALLIDLLELLQRRPESNTAMILGHWYGSPAGERLNQLASQERLIPAEGIEKQFRDTIELLMQHPKRRNLDARVDKLKDKNYAEISELEKLEIIQGLQEKQRLDQERGK